jgi:hypothetical protein
MNLVELVKSQFGGDTVGRIASIVGAPADATRGAVNAAIPTILAGLGQIAESPGGARRLASAVDSVDDGIVDNLSSVVSAGGQSLMEGGSNLLNTLFSGGAIAAIAGAISRFTGLGAGAVTSLLGAIAPIILGVLKGQKRQMGLDAGGLGSLLTSQKQNIINAIPAGMRPALGNIPGLSGLGEWTGTARDTAANAYDAGRTAVRHGAPVAAATATNAARWAVPLVVLLALGALVWYLVSRDRATPDLTTPESVTAVPDPRDATLASAEIPPAATALRDEVSGWFKSATQTFSGITDAASAEAALPKLRELSTQIQTVETSLRGLPVDARASVTSLFGTSWDTLKPAIDRALAIPGVAERIKPVVDEIATRARSLVGQ